MKILSLNCELGAAGDMLAGALLELIYDRAAFLQEMQGVGLAEVSVSAERADTHGIAGTSFLAEGADRHEPICWTEMQQRINGLHLIESERRDVLGIYGILAEAESHVHGVPAEQVHFHEIGSASSLADIVCIAKLMGRIHPDRVICSAVTVGCGTIATDHGPLSIPAPACAEILRGIPVRAGDLAMELCTPTGAAVLKYYADSFGPFPEMEMERIGYGLGGRETGRPAYVRAILGSGLEAESAMTELACNLDDMTPEALAFACEELRAAGALDVYCTRIEMKKGRPGTILTCMCFARDRERMLHLIFLHTTTLGIREYACRRYGLEQTGIVRSTPLGEIHFKQAEGYGVHREKAEYEDLAVLARRKGCSIAEIREELRTKQKEELSK